MKSISKNNRVCSYFGWRRVCAYLVLLAVFSPAKATASHFVGARRCGECHENKYASWSATGHSSILREAAFAEKISVPLPEGYRLEDLSYIIGGHRWKMLFLDNNGFLVTRTAGGDGDNQFNVQSGDWSDFHPGEKFPYTCGQCHTTGFFPDGHQGGLAGIQGTWRFEGVQCEACHGPGGEHAESPLTVNPEADPERSCRRCHGTEPLGAVPLEDPFLAPYTEANQLAASPMAHMQCVDCHDPHLSGPAGLRSSCGDCHPGIVELYEGSFKDRLGLTCPDCHMPPSGIVAEGDPERFLGDLKSHLFRIEHHEGFTSVRNNGDLFNPGYLNVDYSCKPCHFIFETTNWAKRYDATIHRLEVTASLKVFRVQRMFTLVGLVFAVISLLTGLGMKGLVNFPWKGGFTVSLHRHAVWVTFGIYLSVGITCLYFHAPLHDPEKIFKTGLFTLHPILGSLALLLYFAKTIVVRIYRAGWRWPGWSLGLALFLFWVLQYATVVLK